MEIKQEYLPVPSQRRSGEKLNKVQYIIAHDTGGIDGTAQSNVSWYIKSANDMQASANVFVDDKEAIWCIPEDEKAWSVRYNAGIAPNVAPHFMNDCAIAIELCYFTDTARTQAAYNNYVQLMATLCKKYSLDPSTAVVAHSKLDPTRRSDPQNAFQLIGKTYEQFIGDISAIITSAPQAQKTMDITKDTPQVLTINSVKVFWTKTVDGKETVSGETDIAITDETVEAMKAAQEPDWNITVVK